MSPWPNYSSKKTIDMSDVLFDSLYDSELPNAKGCAQWKIELQFFGKGGSVIVSRPSPYAQDNDPLHALSILDNHLYLMMRQTCGVSGDVLHWLS